MTEHARLISYPASSPSDHEAITALDDARSSAETAWRNLPEDLAIQLSGREDGPAGLPPVCGLLHSLAWLAGPVFECKTETEGAGLCLPVALDDLQVLAQIEPSLAEPVKRLAAGGLSEGALEEALRALIVPCTTWRRRTNSRVPPRIKSTLPARL